MSDTVVLSVCIATVNRAAFIGATLESVVSQATDEVEIVIVDGASTDGTEDIVGEYQRRFPRLRYHRPQNRSLLRVACRSEHIARSNKVGLGCCRSAYLISGFWPFDQPH